MDPLPEPLQAFDRPAVDPLTEADLPAVHAHVGTRFVPPGPHWFPALIPALIERANRAGVHPAV